MVCAFIQTRSVETEQCVKRTGPSGLDTPCSIFSQKMIPIYLVCVIVLKILELYPTSFCYSKCPEQNVEKWYENYNECSKLRINHCNLNHTKQQLKLLYIHTCTKLLLLVSLHDCQHQKWQQLTSVTAFELLHLVHLLMHSVSFWRNQELCSSLLTFNSVSYKNAPLHLNLYE